MRRLKRHATTATWLVAWLVTVLVAGSFALAQPGEGRFKIKDWKLPEFYKRLPTDPPGTNRLKTLVQGAEAVPLPDNQVQVTRMQLGNFNQKGLTNLLATAPECLVNVKDRIAHSPGPLKIETARGQLLIEGVGFHCQMTNIVLHISNKVQTVIRRELLQRSDAAASRLAVTPPPGLGPAPAKPPVRISSDTFLYRQASNIVVYTGNVRVLDPLMQLTCHLLTIHLTTNGSIREIVAEQDVQVVGTNNQTRASGDQAVYRLGQDSERVELTGNPARWQDALRNGRGPLFVFYPRSNRITSPQPSHVRLPRADLVQPGFDFSGSPTDAPPAGKVKGTNEFVEITADVMGFQTLGTNQAARTMMASNNVVIISTNDQSRASGNQARYSDVTGLFELIGDARWASRDRLVTGDAFRFDRTNRTFHVTANARLQMPVTSLGKNTLLSSVAPQSTPEAPPVMIDVESARLNYQTNQLVFDEAVRVRMTQLNQQIGHMNCGRLTLLLAGNRVERMIAQDKVVMVQPPALNDTTNRVEKRLMSEWFTLYLHTNGNVNRMVAETNVHIRQTEYASGDTNGANTDLHAEVVTAWFQEATNEVDRIVAERNVIIEQVEGRATGDQAVYTRGADTLVLSGDVALESASGLLNAPTAILKHFGLWPGKLRQFGFPIRPPEEAPQPSNITPDFPDGP